MGESHDHDILGPTSFWNSLEKRASKIFLRSGGAHQHDRVQKKEVYILSILFPERFRLTVGIVSGNFHL